MAIDIRTLIIILGISHIVQVIVFAHQYAVNKNFKGVGWWFLWSVAEVIGFGFMLLRGIPSIFHFVIIVQNFSIITGMIFIYIGIMRFYDKKENLKIVFIILALFAALFLSFIFVYDDIKIRSAIISVTLGVISLLIARSLLRYKIDSISTSVNFNFFLFIIHGVYHLFRSIMLFGFTDYGDVFAPTLFNIMTYMDALVVSTLWTFGFVIMLNQRSIAEMNEAKMQFELIFNTIPDAIIISSLAEGIIVNVNRGFCVVSGYEREECLGRSTIEINLWRKPEERELLTEILKETGCCNNLEFEFLPKDRNPITGLISAKVFDLDGIPMVLSVIRNINDRKQAIDSLKKYTEELNTLNNTKDKLFSIIAHDLRSPLHGFLNVTESMIDKRYKYTLEDFTVMGKALNESARKVAILLENLLEWSQVQSGSLEYSPERLNVSRIISQCLDSMSTLALKKEITIIQEVSDTLEIFADKRMLNTIIRNLLSNAVKFTNRKGQINIKACNTADNSVQISVSDTGIGIPSNLLNKLFKMEERVGRKGTEGEASSGLGLLLCWEFVVRHNGIIWVQSEESTGSTFYFTIPSPIKNSVN